jgi:NodT family efflux transporter outer membrane factor (OMF) lipoprotein
VKTRALAFIALVTVTACAPGPKYVRPETPAPPAFKESAGWQPARPQDEVLRGKWWELFQDPALNALEERVTVSNQTLRAAQAQFAEARAALRFARASQMPEVSAGASVTNYNQSYNQPLWNDTSPTHYNDYLLHLDAAYEIDVWGRLRAGVAARLATAQASAADVETVSLSLHAELASDYLALRALDADREILDSSVEAYQKALELTRNRYKGGVASAVDVAQAETQLETTRAQAVDIRARRAQVEHGIAVLVGEPASSVTLPSAPLAGETPVIPAGLPSDLLERRPDIAAAERRVAAANAQIGVAAAAFFPALTLTGSTGFESVALVDLLRSLSGFWLAGPAVAVTLFDGGRRRSVSDQAKAEYEHAVALYQETALTAFRDVEDALVALRVLADEAAVQQAALAASERSLALSFNRYKGGVATYLEVVTAQNAVLASRRAVLDVLTRRLTATVFLVKALGGGWHASPSPAL